ncbi:MAG: HEPN domain-containing protein [Deltaproteobacteria bacterium]|nr:HEPN domain-containing protein [Deltaproteobacteria bacterium]
MKRPDDPDVGAWLVKASEDLAVVAVLRERAPHLDAAICFHCQQAAEKLLKAVLVAFGDVPPRTHDLAALVEEAAARLPALADLLADATYLSPFAVLPRYPVAPAPGIEATVLVADAEARARRIERAVLALLTRPDGP